ncbi:MAG: hypothetical protein RLZZ563_1673 [Pseudomonadota bacterium]
MALGTLLLAMGFGILTAAAATVAGFGGLATLAAYVIGSTATLAALLVNDLSPDQTPTADSTAQD